ncbi:MAG TPA: ADP-ribosylglycohydrolase family protein [Chthonomonadaceae bacterium]|nr:ADP-ribosylglycohydrolase family protein [Chthonomonadaceae bacterium]
MIGAIAGDFIGSVYESGTMKRTDFPLFHPFCRFTDDTVLTVALADSILNGTDYTSLLKSYFRRYPGAGYGGTFYNWASSPETRPYNSWGNGSAMRVSPVGWAYDTLEEVLVQAERSASVTHNHPEGIKGAQAIASALFLARTGQEKPEIRDFIETTFGYDLREPLDSLREHYTWDVSCQRSVPPALLAFLESESWEDAVRKGISLGGDSDTIGCMAGAVAEAYYGGVPEPIQDYILPRLDAPLAAVVAAFTARYGKG